MAQDRRPFRFVHTADLHLDSPLELRQDAAGERLDGATRRALSRLVDLCIEESVDALLIAGDLYDGDRHSAMTSACLSLEMRRLRGAGIRVFIVRGNHDAASSLTRTLDLPDNVHVFDGRGKPVAFEGHDVMLHGISFNQRHVHGSLLDKYREPVSGCWNVGLMHTSLDGPSEHDPYAPCSLASLRAHGFDYWALGHIHRRCVHSTEPAVVMPGIPQGRHINESGACSVTLVTLQEGSKALLEQRAVRVATFERLDVDVDGAADRTDVLDRLDTALRTRCSERSGENDDTRLIVRPRLHGCTDAAFTLEDAPERLLEEAHGLAQRHDDTFIDKLELDVRTARDVSPSDADALPLDELFAADVLTGASATAYMDREWDQLRKLLPAAYHGLLGETAEERAELQRTLLADGVRRVRARLSRDAVDADR